MRRRLFAVERMMLAGGRPYNITLAVRVRGALDEARLRDALDWLQRRHAVLGEAVVGVRGQEAFGRIAPVRGLGLRIAARAGETDWQRVVRDEVDAPFALETGPLLRLVWVRAAAPGAPGELVLSWHHVIGDARSGLGLLHALLARLNGAGSDADAPPVIGSVTDVFGRPGIRKRMAARLWAWVAGCVLVAIAASTLWRRPRPTAPSVLHWFELDETATACLRARARAAGVSVYAICATVLLRSYRAVLGDAACNRLVCAIDVRERFAIRHPELLFASPPNVTLRLDRRLDADVWAQAGALGTALRRGRARLRPELLLLAGEHLHGLVGPLVASQLRAPTRIDMSFSGLGEVAPPAAPDDAAVRAVELLAVTGTMPWSDTMMMVSWGSAGRLRFCLLTDARKLPGGTAERFVAEACATLEGLAGTAA